MNSELPRRRLVAILLATALLVGVVFLLREWSPPSEPTTSPSNITSILGGDATGFERAILPRKFEFPSDHGPHPKFRHEWWYFTGNLATPDKRHFGFQLTFFRFGLSPEHDVSRKSKWATRQVYMAHFALTDVSNQKFYAFQRYSRSALDLAGANSQPFRVWLDDWKVDSVKNSEIFPMHLQAAEANVRLDLHLKLGKDLVLQGDQGLSQKSAQPGNASYYYSFIRIPTDGSVTIEGEQYSVSGLSWMDREWGSGALAKNQVGWDWFALHLSDGRELMFYRLRHQDGSVDAFSGGSLSDKQGHTITLRREDVNATPTQYWRSPKTNTNYPLHWRIEIPKAHLILQITPYVNAQELNLDVVYWEGAVKVKGTSYRQPIGGDGYVELTGYGAEAATKVNTP